ncbi:MAG: hypothetical protein JW395_1621 [Nitrospira sp.]|nr:hypothetical protein [Nitrospira sp.]
MLSELSCNQRREFLRLTIHIVLGLPTCDGLARKEIAVKWHLQIVKQRGPDVGGGNLRQILSRRDDNIFVLLLTSEGILSADRG